MTDLIDVAMDVQMILQNLGWRFTFIGGLAVQQWGEPRLTRDVDLSVLTGFGHEESFIDELLCHFQPRVSNCREFALRNRVVLLQHRERVGIDIALAGLPFEEGMIDRAVEIEVLPGKRLSCARRKT